MPRCAGLSPKAENVATQAVKASACSGASHALYPMHPSARRPGACRWTMTTTATLYASLLLVSPFSFAAVITGVGANGIIMPAFVDAGCSRARVAQSPSMPVGLNISAQNLVGGGFRVLAVGFAINALCPLTAVQRYTARQKEASGFGGDRSRTALLPGLCSVPVLLWSAALSPASPTPYEGEHSMSPSDDEVVEFGVQNYRLSSSECKFPRSTSFTK